MLCLPLWYQRLPVMLDALECLLWHRPALLTISLYFNQARPQFQVTRMSLLFNLCTVFTRYMLTKENLLVYHVTQILHFVLLD